MKWRSVIAGMALGGIGCIAAVDHGAAQDLAAAVKERQEIMKTLWPNYYGSFSQVARGQSTDIAPLPQKSQDAATALRKFATLFPPGSARESIPESRAKPDIWARKAEYDSLLAKLIEETEKLSAISRGGNLEAVKAQIAVVSQACGGCHSGNPKGAGTFRYEAP